MSRFVGILALSVAPSLLLGQGRPNVLWIAGGHYLGVNEIAFASDGVHCYSASDDQTVKAWDYPNRKCLFTLEGLSGPARQLALSTDGSLLVASDNDGKIALWNISTHQFVRKWQADNLVNDVLFSNDGQYVIAVGSSREVRFWRVSDGGLAKSWQVSGSMPTTVALSHDGLTLATGAGTIRTWTLNGNMLHEYFPSVPVVFSLSFGLRDDQIFGAGDYAYRCWDVNTANLIWANGGDGSSGKILPNPQGQYVTGTGFNRYFPIWRATDGVRVNTLTVSDKPNNAWFSLNGDEIAWTPTSQNILTMEFPSGVAKPNLGHHTKIVSGIEFSPLGDKVATCSNDHTVRLFDATSGQLLKLFYDGSILFERVHFSPDGTSLALSAENSWPVILEAESLSNQRILNIYSQNGTSDVAYSPDGKILACVGRDQKIFWCSAISGITFRRTAAHTGQIHACEFAPTSEWLVTASEDRTAKIWKYSDGSLLATLSQSQGGLWSVAVSPRATNIATGSTDGTVRVYRSSDWSLVATVNIGSRTVRSVAFSRDGARLFAGTQSKLVEFDTSSWAIIKEFDREIGFGVQSLTTGGTNRVAYGRLDGTVVMADIP
ncbi:MAG: hypothetical protein JNM34_01525 [Chthonomonadaceae bacterium]|nr:hypothetical protein [Chthonomonadaceae bacterium]